MTHRTLIRGGRLIAHDPEAHPGLASSVLVGGEIVTRDGRPVADAATVARCAKHPAHTLADRAGASGLLRAVS